MAGSRKRSSMWEDDFEDIRSQSQGPPVSRRPRPAPDNRRPRPPEQRRPGRPDRPPRRPEPDWEIPRWELSDRNRGGRPDPGRPGRTGTSPRNAGRPAPPSRKRLKKRISVGARRAAAFLIVLIMAGATALLAIFLLFKISDIQITGDAVADYQNADILDICGYEVGENLIFLSTKDKEKKLKESLPYIGEVSITRHLPGTLEIHLTAAEVTACISNGSSWLYISNEGKVLEKREKPENGVLQIAGLTLLDEEPGRILQVEDEDSRTACLTILTALAELGEAENFTYLDLSDLSNIRLMYQNTVEFQLGNVLDLAYKVEFGCQNLKKMESTEKGVMDLSHASETKRAFFTPGEVSVPTAQTPQNSQGNQTAAASQSPASSGNPRTDGIPDTAYTGGADDTEDGGDDGWDDTGDSDDNWDDEDGDLGGE